MRTEAEEVQEEVQDFEEPTMDSRKFMEEILMSIKQVPRK
jgi:hypothetical protein